MVCRFSAIVIGSGVSDFHGFAVSEVGIGREIAEFWDF